MQNMQSNKKIWVLYCAPRSIIYASAEASGDALGSIRIKLTLATAQLMLKLG